MLIAGIDEAGRGPLAGPVVAATAIFEDGYFNSEIKDSKQLSPKKREKLYEIIKREAKAWAIVAVGHQRIGQLNIRGASLLAMKLSLERASRLVLPDLVLVDGNVPIETELPQRTVVSGDSLHVQISAASILAKVWRDHLMLTMDRKYPGYGFAKHAGYGTKDHMAAIRHKGPCPVHRLSFRGVREYADGQVYMEVSSDPVREPNAPISGQQSFR
jgi:ribonuclease HII